MKTLKNAKNELFNNLSSWAQTECDDIKALNAESFCPEDEEYLKYLQNITKPMEKTKESISNLANLTESEIVI